MMASLGGLYQQQPTTHTPEYKLDYGQIALHGTHGDWIKMRTGGYSLGIGTQWRIQGEWQSGHGIHCGQLVLTKISKIRATRFQIFRLKCTKFDFRWALRELTALPRHPSCI